MKIQNKSPHSVMGSTTNSHKSSFKRTNSRGASTHNLSESAKVDVSSRGKDINKAMNIAKNTRTDEAKLNRLQQMIDKGTYKPDASSVADKLVDEHLIFKS